ncbi:MAG TPA: hypothetical protein VGK24_04055 [Candidatus Angelobacter sp.]
MEFLGVKGIVCIGIGEKYFGRKGIKQRKQIRFLKIFGRLRGHDENAIVLAPGLGRLDQIVPDDLHCKEFPRFIKDKNLEGCPNGRVVNDRASAMEDVEKQRLDKLRVFVHALKVKALELR